ncbi:MAG TPA: flagellar biosynthetic protein FliO [Opitutaceae bacterium]|nr:flagellar biosynthetic protein FliO [Opitutaceae bacterium]
MKFLPFTSVTRWLLVVIGCVVLATAQPMSADENSPAAPARSASGTTKTEDSGRSASGTTPEKTPAPTVTLPDTTPGTAATPAPSVTPSPAPAAAPANAGKIIYPKAADTDPDRTIDGKTTGSSSRSYLLVVAFLLAGAGAWVLMQKRRGVSVVTRGPRKLNVDETRPLGNRQYLVVASYEDKKFLLGVTAGQIQMLAKLDEGEGEP